MKGAMSAPATSPAVDAASLFPPDPWTGKRPSRPTREGWVATPEGGRLYFRAEGEGPALLCSNGIGVSTFFWGPVGRELADRYTVVRWDYRGHGLSDDSRDPSAANMTLCAEDGLRVMDHLGIDRAVLLGHSMGAQVGFELVRLAPERVAGLVPTLGTYRRAIETFLDLPISLPAFGVLERLLSRPRVAKLARKGFTAVMQSPLADPGARLSRFVHPELCPPEALVPYLRHNTRIDLQMYAALAASMQSHDASELLPTLQVPTLVVAGDGDLFTPVRLAHEMAALIPGAELFVIPRGSHAALVEQPLLLALRVRKFLNERVAGWGR